MPSYTWPVALRWQLENPPSGQKKSLFDNVEFEWNLDDDNLTDMSDDDDNWRVCNLTGMSDDDANWRVCNLTFMSDDDDNWRYGTSPACLTTMPTGVDVLPIHNEINYPFSCVP